jgi:hypothetical protein
MSNCVIEAEYGDPSPSSYAPSLPAVRPQPSAVTGSGCDVDAAGITE